MRIKVTHHLDDLQRDIVAVVPQAAKDTRAAVRHGAMTGRLVAQQHAREAAGPHGKDFYKRITWDEPRRSLFGGIGWSAEFGPTGVPKTDFIGAGFRHGENTDLAVAAPHAIGVVAQDVRKAMDGWFWAGGDQ